MRKEGIRGMSNRHASNQAASRAQPTSLLAAGLTHPLHRISRPRRQHPQGRRKRDIDGQPDLRTFLSLERVHDRFGHALWRDGGCEEAGDRVEVDTGEEGGADVAETGERCADVRGGVSGHRGDRQRGTVVVEVCKREREREGTPASITLFVQFVPQRFVQPHESMFGRDIVSLVGGTMARKRK